MSQAGAEPEVPTESSELEQMHETYLQGGRESGIAPHVVYQISDCPHSDCDQHMQAIDFRLVGAIVGGRAAEAERCDRDQCDEG